MSAAVCPECRKPIPASAPAGQCPDCLLKRGLERAGFASAAFAATTPQGGRAVPLSTDFVAQYFPQMEIVEVLGQGGMGTVFKAKQTKLDRLVAVKIIRPETANDPAFAERFMREAKTLARLNHPSIVGVHDFGEIDLTAASANSGNPVRGTLFYFIMEYVDGANLRQLMQSGQISPDMALGVVQQVCDALQYAHGEGVVHRDIKPENIMLDTKGRVKIADFGLAKLAEGSGNDWTLTGTHQVMGTPRYMAPEQMAGSRDVDHRADIYSLAVVFYEMLTGTIPMGHFAPPSKKAAVDVRFDEVILKAMATEPDLRFQSVRDLRAGLDHIASGVAGEPHPSMAAMPGFSTIIDRGVAGAWRMMNGREPAVAARKPFAPVLIVTILAVIGAGSLFPMFGLISRFSDPAAISRHSPLLILSIVLFSFCGAILHIVPSSSRSTGWTFGGLLLLSGLVVVSLMLVTGVIPSMLLPVYAISIVCAVVIVVVSLVGLQRSMFPGDAQSRPVARTDSVVMTREQLDQGILPDICAICGEPTTNRQTHSIQYQPKWAEAASLGGYTLGGIPGVIIHMMTSHKVHVPCPICEKHTGDRHSRNVYASIGWVLIPVLGGLGAFMGHLRWDTSEDHIIATAVPMGIVGLVAYITPVIYMSWNVVHCEQNSDGKSKEGQICIRRVCSAFASEVRRRQSNWTNTAPKA
ncbi:MAG: serine/threonine-protein kinase [Planctomycetaceae bacterium]